MSTNRPFPMTVTVPIIAVVTPEDDGGFSAVVPSLPGCVTEGDTLDELQANLREAAMGWLASQHDHEMAKAHEDQPERAVS